MGHRSPFALHTAFVHTPSPLSRELDTGTSTPAVKTDTDKKASVPAKPPYKPESCNRHMVSKALIALKPPETTTAASASDVIPAATPSVEDIAGFAKKGKSALIDHLMSLMLQKPVIEINFNNLDTHLQLLIRSSTMKTVKIVKSGEQTKSTESAPGITKTEGGDTENEASSLKKVVVDIESLSRESVPLAKFDEFVAYLYKYGVMTELINTRRAQALTADPASAPAMPQDPVVALASNPHASVDTLLAIHAMESSSDRFLPLANPRIPKHILRAAEHDIQEKIRNKPPAENLPEIDADICKHLTSNPKVKLETLDAIYSLNDPKLNSGLMNNLTFEQAHAFDVLSYRKFMPLLNPDLPAHMLRVGEDYMMEKISAGNLSEKDVKIGRNLATMPSAQLATLEAIRSLDDPEINATLMENRVYQRAHPFEILSYKNSSAASGSVGSSNSSNSAYDGSDA